ncbi:TlpA family protein disulfide reductase [Winogradskyella thalassocola]|uniref:Thiol-disulfide isomerase or thioredoxin n=1 Tax=Winogradskyella thalassocola TaxID=262004 RepID=A0A1G8L5Y9_9FLAO|nr:thioredoxin-like domain-containing protein [Winogradskyella thalassocola]SDI51005.1 Thiol-disulfide isomerase or thioredoxin [Winogradskyella thalassocola]
MKRILYFLIIPFLISCQDEKSYDSEISNNDYSEVIVSGTIENRPINDTINTFKIYINNLLGDEQFKVETISIEDSGEFRTSLLLNNPQTITLAYKAVEFNLILKPSDSVNIIFKDNYDTKKDVFTDAKLSGSLAALNKELFTFLASRELNMRTYYNKLKDLNPDSYKTFYDSIFGADANNIDRFLAENNVSQTLKDWLFVEKHYVPVDNLLGFPLYYEMFHPEASKTVQYNDSFFSNLERLPELKASHLVNSKINSIGNYLRFHYSKKLSPKGVKTEIKKLDSLVIRELKQDFNSNKLLLQLAVYDIINYSFENNNLDFLTNEKDFIENLYTNSIFENIINTRTETIKLLVKNPEIPKNAELLEFNYDTAEAFIEDITRTSDKKIIYIDNWAVWCSPCRSEFKEATPQLKKEFSDSVEFIYICHKSDETLWKPMIAQYKLEGKHYFVTEKQNLMLTKYLDITGFPNYNIFDKNGKMLYGGFEYRPSEPITKELLNKLTK